MRLILQFLAAGFSCDFSLLNFDIYYLRKLTRTHVAFQGWRLAPSKQCNKLGTWWHPNQLLNKFKWKSKIYIIYNILHTGIPTNININDKPSTNPTDIANAFNAYFTSVADNLLTKNFSEIETKNNKDPITYLRQNFRHCYSQINLKNTTTREINKIINSMKNKTSHGYDEISDKILRASSPFILSPLTYIFNKVLSSGIFPDRLKYSEIQPLFKKGKKTSQITDPFHFYLPFQKLLKRLYIRGYTVP